MMPARKSKPVGRISLADCMDCRIKPGHDDDHSLTLRCPRGARASEGTSGNAPAASFEARFQRAPQDEGKAQPYERLTRTASTAELLVDPAAQRARRHDAAVAGDFAAAAEQDHRWNRADAIAGRQVLLGVGIDLGEAQPRLERLGRGSRTPEPWRGRVRTRRPRSRPGAADRRRRGARNARRRD